MSEGTGGERVIADRYRLIGELGRGGMGVVWRARDELLGREVAVKEVRAPAGLDEGEVRQLYARLEQEGRAAARIIHPNVITVYDVAVAGGAPWIVMELVRGLTLADVLDADGPMTPRRAADIGAHVLAGLRAAHIAGVLHRDVKPGNVLIANDGRVVLTDFGIAMIEGTSALTRTGELIGSPEYLAPERGMGNAPGPESDLWSLGVLIYRSVEGSSPFRRDSALSTLSAAVNDPLPEPRRAGPLGPVLEGLLRKRPADRISGSEAQRMLDDVAAGRTGPPATGYAPAASGPSPRTKPLPRPMPSGGTGGTGGPTPPTVPGYGSPYGPGPSSYGAEPDPTRRRRVATVLAAGALVLALAAGVVAWTLLDQGTEDDKASTGGTGSSTSSSTSSTGTGTSTTATTPPTTTASPTVTTTTASPSSSGAPVAKVTIKVTAGRDSYTGPCPAPAGRAPEFTAVIAVDHTPATVVFRWTTDSGRNSDPGWKTAEFAAGGPTSRTYEHTELSFEAGRRSTDRIVVEVGAPKEFRSDPVSFTVDCRPDPPASTTTPAAAGTNGTDRSANQAVNQAVNQSAIQAAELNAGR
ncbi:serine/threonine-protein kinase [Streptomyces sp. RKAG293]|uniref:serine/threonine-protein kinase n=1 Tax=Streptomyces sp. RKAG293 TaxID=2893403 RepID=UPI00203447F1|nr:serine/threonine-protein kinase [Streptomyces sp. RKAG293]MCM2418526.1 serine/threonine protein kinase [Streptomyces sp. RKAG293]